MSDFSNILIDWYGDHQRDLPWRKTKDPYLIWVSEVILQQTRVEQGYEYYEHFVKRFPDVFTLAAAEEDEVMKHWQGLGYYSRARNMYAAAKTMASTGGFPTSYEAVRALKGVGDYTAAAICSFAYDMPYAVVDGNVFRVLSRWLGIDRPIDSSEGKKMVNAAAKELLDKQRAALYNQAIMEFGALQCTPSAPACLFCPFADSCFALHHGTVDVLPVKRHRTKVSNRYFNYLFVRMGNETFIHKRTIDDIWKNLYELPLIETDKDLPEEEFYASADLQTLFDKHDKPSFRLVKRGIKHVLSHRVIHTNFYEVVLPPESNSFREYQRIKISNLHKFAVSRLINQFLSVIL